MALLLRGVNVGTNNSLPMATLRAMLEATGCVQVATYLQSGNAVFGTTRGLDEVREAVEARLAEYLGRPIDTTLRTGEELRAVVRARPFGEVASDEARLCVTFLARPPARAELAPLDAQDWKPELFEVKGREIYTWYPAGQGRSPLAQAVGKLKLQGAVTTRNWRTVLALTQLLAPGGTTAAAGLK